MPSPRQNLGQQGEDSAVAHGRQGGAAASVTGRKQRRLIRAAEYFLLRNPQHGLRPCRFDVIALDGDAPADWIRDAFRVPSP